MPTLQEQIGQGQQYDPLASWGDKPGVEKRHPEGLPPVEDPFIYSPYGQAVRGREKKGRFPVYGGRRDLAKSIATRSLAIEGIKSQMAQSPQIEGLASTINRYAQDNPYLASMVGAYQNQLGGQSLLQDQENQMRLRELMQGAYVLGGGLYGAAIKADTIAAEQKRARDRAKTQQLQAIVGGAMRGLGLNQYGEADTTEGFIGGLEL